ncbi:MAG: hypothetical protein K0Q95_1736 [Bacteroidota bacterium]|jgi:hypothetical protein|nr:hypothetical protein [Bacteroidota bacterium]
MKAQIGMLVAAIALTMVTTSCEKDDNSSNGPAALVDDNGSGGNGSDDGTENVSHEPKWKVTVFKEDEKDETNHFNGYLLRFNTDGSANAFNSTGVTKGTWRKSENNFVINFPSEPLSELNDDWQIISETKTHMELEHISGGDGSRDYLVLDNSLLK